MFFQSKVCLAIGLCLIYFCNECWSKNIYCGGSSSERDIIVDFKSGRRFLQYKKFEDDDVTCQVVIKVPINFYAIRIDFIDVEMDGPNIFGTSQTPGVCDSDMFILKGFTGWTPPPRCGKLTGYSFLIDENANIQRNSIKIVALMSSKSFKWHIRVSQISRPLNMSSMLSTGFVLSQSLSHIPMYQSQSRFPSVKAIKYGSPIKELTLPYLVSIQKKSSFVKDILRTSNCSGINRWTHRCGGSIINDRMVLTTAECFHHVRKFKWENRIKHFRVVAGDFNICRTKTSSEDNDPAYYKIKNVVFHYGYDPLLQFHDVAILVLEKPIKFDQYVQPIQLNEVDDLTNKLEGVIGGFGSWDSKTGGYSKDKLGFLNFTHTTTYFPFEPHVSKLSLDPTSSCSFSKTDERMKKLNGRKPFSELRKYSHAYESIRCGIASKEQAMNSVRGTKGFPGVGDEGGPFVSFDSQGLPKLTGIILNPKRNPWNEDYRSERLFSSVAYYGTWIKSVVAAFKD